MPHVSQPVAVGHLQKRVCIISWIRSLLSAEGSSPRKRDRVNHQPVPRRVCGLGVPAHGRGPGRALQCLLQSTSCFLLLTCSFHAATSSPGFFFPGNSSPKFKFPEKIFKTRVISRDAAFGPEVVTDTHYLHFLPPILDNSLSASTSQVEDVQNLIPKRCVPRGY